MTRRVRLRRWARVRGKRRAAARMSQSAPAAPRRGERTAAAPRRLWQAVVCGALFVSLVLLKLVMPGHLSAFRGTLAQWLVRDADFVSAFSAVGHALAAPERFAESLGDAYVAVFGENDAAEVGGTVELAQPAETERPLPEYASAERPELPFAYASPLAGTLTSPFGWREDPNTGEAAFHTGVDLAAEDGTPFACFAAGTVGVVGESTVLGKYVTVRHEGGYETLYAHCGRIGVSSGQSVGCGETLGAVGATGNATGAHLHFELLDGSTYLDPLAYVEQAAG